MPQKTCRGESLALSATAYSAEPFGSLSGTNFRDAATIV